MIYIRFCLWRYSTSKRYFWWNSLSNHWLCSWGL